MKIFRAYTLYVRNMHVFVKFAMKVFDLSTYIGKSPKTLSCLLRVRRLPPSFHIALYYGFIFLFNLFFCFGGENSTRGKQNPPAKRKQYSVARASPYRTRDDVVYCNCFFYRNQVVVPRSMRFKRGRIRAICLVVFLSSVYIKQMIFVEITTI